MSVKTLFRDYLHADLKKFPHLQVLQLTEISACVYVSRLGESMREIDTVEWHVYYPGYIGLKKKESRSEICDIKP